MNLDRGCAVSAPSVTPAPGHRGSCLRGRSGFGGDDAERLKRAERAGRSQAPSLRAPMHRKLLHHGQERPGQLAGTMAEHCMGQCARPCSFSICCSAGLAYDIPLLCAPHVAFQKRLMTVAVSRERRKGVAMHATQLQTLHIRHDLDRPKSSMLMVKLVRL